MVPFYNQAWQLSSKPYRTYSRQLFLITSLFDIFWYFSFWSLIKRKYIDKWKMKHKCEKVTLKKGFTMTRMEVWWIINSSSPNWTGQCSFIFVWVLYRIVGHKLMWLLCVCNITKGVNLNNFYFLYVIFNRECFHKRNRAMRFKQCTEISELKGKMG